MEESDLRSVLSVISDLGHFSREKRDLGAGRSVFTDISDLRSVFPRSLFTKIPTLAGQKLTLPRDNSDLARAETDLGLGRNDLGSGQDGKN